jgi:hypothetical protein
MNFQGYLEDSYKLIKREPLILIGGGFLLQLLLFLSQGLLFLIAGPFLGGYMLLIILAFRENKKPVFNDIFSGFYSFRSLLPYTLVVLIIFIGFMLFVIPGLVFATWWIYVLPLMIDKKKSYSEAMGISMRKVNQTGFFMHLIFLLLITLIPIMFFNFIALSIPFLLILSVLLPPFQAGCLASLYIDQFKVFEEQTEDEQAEKPVTEKLLTGSDEKKIDEETEKKIHNDNTEPHSAEATVQDIASGKPATDESHPPKQLPDETRPSSGSGTEMSDINAGLDSKKKS